MSQETYTETKRQKFWSGFKNIALALLVAGAIRGFWFEPYRIPSPSMVPTLVIGDYLYVSKSTYGYSRYSLPFSPPIPGADGKRIFAKMPRRGDVVVFKYPPNPSQNYIKRLIGLPGDKIQVISGVVYVNGRPLPQKRIADYTVTEPSGRKTMVPQFVETAPDGRTYRILRASTDGRQSYDNTPLFEVPSDHFFLMGDNRNNSGDSRGPVGYVPFDHLLGPARFIFFSARNAFTDLFLHPTEIFDRIRLGRFFNNLQPSDADHDAD